MLAGEHVFAFLEKGPLWFLASKTVNKNLSDDASWIAEVGVHLQHW